MNTQELLEEYDLWSRKRSIQGKDDSPAAFMKERHMGRILLVLNNMLRDDRDDRYPLEEYLEDDDIEWIKAQGPAALVVDGEV